MFAKHSTHWFVSVDTTNCSITTNGASKPSTNQGIIDYEITPNNNCVLADPLLNILVEAFDPTFNCIPV